MSLLERLRTWRALRRERPVFEDSAVQFGREAELLLRDILTTHFKHKGAHLFAGRRVPCPRRRMRREIDLIVLTPQMISLIEVKSWSGELFDRGAVWVQVRRGGDELRHPNLIADNLEKRDAFVNHLRKHGLARERDFAARHLVQKVVFMNPNLVVSPSIARHPDVITRDKLGVFLDRQPAAGFARRMLSSVIEFCLGAEATRGLTGNLDAERFAALVKCVADIRTWDRLRLFGGKTLTGDLYELHVGPTRWARDQLGPRGSVPVAWSRGGWGLFKALTGMGQVGRLVLAGRTALALAVRDDVSFHAVGESAPARLPLTRVEEIILG
jgi:hypothetical protein